MLNANNLSHDCDGNTLTLWIDQTISEAIIKKASDIHIEPHIEKLIVRMRIDGLLHEYASLSIALASRINARVKVLAKMDVAEKRRPQDGRFTFTSISSETRDVRVSTCPTLHGEKIVLRLLMPHAEVPALTQIGLNAEQINLLGKYLQTPQGMILVTGPTGSGKTTTLYSALSEINHISRNIMTVEHPIEITIPGVHQVAVQTKINLDFSNILRTLLRQDPDVLMIGEIRDTETASIAIHAAQTGHLILSTIHSRNTIDTITRLKHIGIPAYQIASSLNLVIAQRLVRKLCDHCKIKKTYAIKSQPTEGYSAKGCSQCFEGYRGRTGVFEFLPITDDFSEAISESFSHQKLLNLAHANNWISILENGYQLIKNGITDFNELKRVINTFD